MLILYLKTHTFVRYNLSCSVTDRNVQIFRSFNKKNGILKGAEVSKLFLLFCQKFRGMFRGNAVSDEKEFRWGVCQVFSIQGRILKFG